MSFTVGQLKEHLGKFEDDQEVCILLLDRKSHGRCDVQALYPINSQVAADTYGITATEYKTDEAKRAPAWVFAEEVRHEG